MPKDDDSLISFIAAPPPSPTSGFETTPVSPDGHLCFFSAFAARLLPKVGSDRTIEVARIPAFDLIPRDIDAGYKRKTSSLPKSNAACADPSHGFGDGYRAECAGHEGYAADGPSFWKRAFRRLPVVSSRAFCGFYLYSLFSLMIIHGGTVERRRQPQMHARYQARHESGHNATSSAESCRALDALSASTVAHVFPRWC